MKKWIPIGVSLLMVVSAVYVGSPYYAVHSLRNSAISADVDQIEARVDFPSVRESLKSQFSIAMMSKLQNDPEMKKNPFAGLGAMVMPALIDRMVDNFVTPEGIAAMMRGQSPSQRGKVESNPDIEHSSSYVNLDRFRVKFRNTKLNEDGPSFLFERRGFATWKLIRLEMPANLLNGGA